MMRRLLLLSALVLVPAWAGDLSSLTEGEADRGLKEALVQGAEAAVGKLSAVDGFMGNPKVRIPLPPTLAKVEGLLRTVGLQKPADELVTTMNRAAESAVVEAKPILLESIKKMTLADAKAILTGPDDSATQYFRKTGGEAIALKFKPKVAVATQKVKLAKRYDKVAGKAARFGLIEKGDANLDDYVTRKAVDGLFLMMAEQEKAIRKDPMGQASSLLRKVFGALKP
ncbi:MAG: hypothetical protein H6Q00_1952 [Holophagaceae bacterium]|nr:hypothetical protein [Holophagaceae bacterium]